MGEIRVESGQLREAAQTVYDAIIPILGYQTYGPTGLSRDAAGDVVLAEATGDFHTHWVANIEAVEASCIGMKKFLSAAADAYEKTDGTIGGVGK
jgi:hypothetical protein